MNGRDQFPQNYIGVKNTLSWDEYFMLQAMISSFKSKDPSTKVGCVIVDENNHQITMGYNGMVSGIDESQLPWGKDKSVPLEHQKYGYVVHAETNAILHTSRSLRNCRAYVTLFPCNECAKLIASKQLGEVIFLSNKDQDSDSHRMARKIFDLAEVRYRQMEISQALLENLQKHLQKIIRDI